MSKAYDNVSTCLKCIPKRELLQNNPLSSYLILLYYEGLSCLLKEEERQQRIHMLKVYLGAPPMSHLLFTDDSLFFYKSTLIKLQGLSWFWLSMKKFLVKLRIKQKINLNFIPTTKYRLFSSQLHNIFILFIKCPFSL